MKKVIAIVAGPADRLQRRRDQRMTAASGRQP
jgi:hypothetical protein